MLQHIVLCVCKNVCPRHGICLAAPVRSTASPTRPHHLLVKLAEGPADPVIALANTAAPAVALADPQLSHAVHTAQAPGNAPNLPLARRLYAVSDGTEGEFLASLQPLTCSVKLAPCPSQAEAALPTAQGPS